MAALDKKEVVGTKVRIANHKVVLHRNGQRVSIKAGQKFPFTAEEIDDITASSPEALRVLVNEDESAPEAKVPVAPKGSATAKASQMDGDRLKAGSATSKSDDL